MVELARWTEIGDVVGGNVTRVNGNGDLHFTGLAGFYPRLVVRGTEPVAGTSNQQIDAGEMIMWVNTGDGDKHYLMYHRSNGNVISKAELAIT
jgi:hypothetical protein